MIALVEMVFTEAVFGRLRGFFLGRVLIWGGVLRWTLWPGLRFGWRRNEHFKHVPQTAGSKHIASHVQWTAYSDVDGQDHDERAETNQKTPNQPQGKSLVHKAKCDPVCGFAQALLSRSLFKSTRRLDRRLAI